MVYQALEEHKIFFVMHEYESHFVFHTKLFPKVKGGENINLNPLEVTNSDTSCICIYVGHNMNTPFRQYLLSKLIKQS